MRKFSTLMLAAFVMLMLAACKPTTIDDVTKRISEGKELSQEDYKIMFDYALESLNRSGDSITKYSDDRIGLARSMKSLSEEYPEANLVNNTILSADTSKLDAANRALYEKVVTTQAELVQHFNDIMYGGVDPMKLIDRTARPIAVEETDSVNVNSPAGGDVRPLTDDDKATGAASTAEKAK